MHGMENKGQVARNNLGEEVKSWLSWRTNVMCVEDSPHERSY